MLAGALSVMFLIYPPAPGWGSSEKWGDIGTWFGSITTGCTAVAATWIAMSERSERKRRDVRRSILMSYELIHPIITLKSEVNSARRCLKAPSVTVREIGYEEFCGMLHLPSGAKFPRGAVLEDILEGLASELADLCRHLVMYEELVSLSIAHRRANRRRV
jgi:hypothetical protein